MRRTPRTSRNARTTRAVIATGLLTLLALLTACAAGDGGIDSVESTDSSGSADAPAESAPGQTGVANQADDALTDGPATASAAGGRAGTAPALDIDLDQLDQRDIIRTGSISLVADDPEEVRAGIGDVLVSLGGYVADESARTRPEGGVDEIRLVVQVPTNRFDAALDEISRLGEIRSRSIQAEDVTGLVADVESRVGNARVALERVRALLDRANSLGTVIRLEGVLANRQSDLEALLAQRDALAGQTSLATLEVLVNAPDAAPPKPKADEADGFLDGLSRGWDAMARAFVLGSTAVGAVLPFVLLALLIAAPLTLWRRRRISSPVVASPAE